MAVRAPGFYEPLDEVIPKLVKTSYDGPRLITEPMPVWEEDDQDYEEYLEETVRLVESLYEESRDYYGPKKMQWRRADQLIELEHILDSLLDKHPEKTRMPLLAPSIEEWLACRYNEPVRPSVAARQAGMEQIIGAGNYLMEQELDANRWNLLRFRIGIDQLKFRIGFYKVTVDRNAKGVFGQEGEHLIERLDPRWVWPDRYATSWEWKHQKYLIIATPMDISDIQRMWPDRGRLVKPDSRLSYYGKEEPGALASMSGGTRMRSASDREASPGKRERALVLECYLKDQRMRRVPAQYDQFHQPVLGPDGEPICEYSPRYPKGRLLIVANGVLLRDTPNPWNHGLPPIVASPACVYDGLFSFSPLEVLDILDRKLNLMVKEAYQNMRVHFNNPWVVDRNAFTKQSQYDEISQKRDLVLIVRPNARVMRLPPGELPSQTFAMFEYLRDCFDHVLGVTKIDRGQLEKGSQLAAQSVMELQGASGERQQVNKQLDTEAAREVGFLTFNNIRQFHPSKMQLQINDPATGQPVTLNWDNTEIKNLWDFKIEAGNASGAEASAQQRATNLYDKGAIDNEELLKVYNWPQSGKVLQRMRDERTRLAQLGFVKEALKLGVTSRAMSQTGPKKQGA